MTTMRKAPARIAAATVVVAAALAVLLDRPGTWSGLARATGVVAWMLLGCSVGLGALMGARLVTGPRRAGVQEVHQFVAVLAVVVTVAHLAVLPLVAGLGIGWRQLVIPFSRLGSAHAQACGVLAVYLLLAITVTSWLRRRLPWRWWRRVHTLALPLFALATGHGLLAGSTEGRWILATLLVVLTAGFVAIRVRGGRTGVPGPVEPPGGLRLLIRAMAWEADGVLSLELVDPDGLPLPAWEPGAHVGVLLAGGLWRHYSLYGDPGDRFRYRIAVLRVSAGRGSGDVHTRLRVGQTVSVSAPRNHFRLVDAPAYVFVAGGIGITPLLSMIRHVWSRRPWHLVYLGRNPRSMAFLSAVNALEPDQVTVRFSDLDGVTDLTGLIAAAPPGAAVYSCGPQSLLTELERLVAAREDLSLHVERFAANPVTTGPACEIELRRTGTVVHVPSDRTLLDVVRAIRPDIPAHCRQGVCGSCRVTVLAGQVDHRDALLTDRERSSGTMLLCVSRARTERLALDL